MKLYNLSLHMRHKANTSPYLTCASLPGLVNVTFDYFIVLSAESWVDLHLAFHSCSVAALVYAWACCGLEPVVVLIGVLSCVKYEGFTSPTARLLCDHQSDAHVKLPALKPPDNCKKALDLRRWLMSEQVEHRSYKSYQLSNIWDCKNKHPVRFEWGTQQKILWVLFCF